MSKTKAVTAYKMEQFIYLNKLRESGETNMVESFRYLQAVFDMTEPEAKKVRDEWMEWVDSNPANLDLGYYDI